MAAQKRRDYEKNREKKIESVRRWRIANPEKYAAQTQRRLHVHKEADADRLRAWKAVPENVLKSGRKYRLKYVERVREHARRYQAAKKNAVPAWADLEGMRAFYLEASRLTQQTGIRHEVDHIIPITSEVVCGLHWEGNLQILPRTENRAKSNRLMEV